MNTTIKTGITPQQQPQPKTTSVAAGSQAATTAASSSVRSTDDSVSLTSSAQAVDAASKVGDSVDTAKVEAIRNAIAAGTYKVDPANIADKLSSMESQLGGVA
jgi:negative regulator of flagellin synthesis FlgM